MGSARLVLLSYFIGVAGLLVQIGRYEVRTLKSSDDLPVPWYGYLVWTLLALAWPLFLLVGAWTWLALWVPWSLRWVRWQWYRWTGW